MINMRIFFKALILRIFLKAISFAEVNFQKKNSITKIWLKIGLKYFQTVTGMLQVQGFSNI